MWNRLKMWYELEEVIEISLDVFSSSNNMFVIWHFTNS